RAGGGVCVAMDRQERAALRAERSRFGLPPRGGIRGEDPLPEETGFSTAIRTRQNLHPKGVEQVGFHPPVGGLVEGRDPWDDVLPHPLEGGPQRALITRLQRLPHLKGGNGVDVHAYRTAAEF